MDGKKISLVFTGFHWFITDSKLLTITPLKSVVIYHYIIVVNFIISSVVDFWLVDITLYASEF